MEGKIKYLYLVITSVASLITSLTVLITVPNGFLDYLKTFRWEKNINIVRLSSDDFIVIYNKNPKPVFISKYEYINERLGIAGYKEINQEIAPYSYLNYSTDDEKAKWDKMFSGTDEKLNEVLSSGLNKLDSPYKLIFFGENHPVINIFNKANPKPRAFELTLNLTVNFEENEKTIPLKANGYIVMRQKK